jgi:hypothetical protein
LEKEAIVAAAAETVLLLRIGGEEETKNPVGVDTEDSHIGVLRRAIVHAGTIPSLKRDVATAIKPDAHLDRNASGIPHDLAVRQKGGEKSRSQDPNKWEPARSHILFLR